MNTRYLILTLSLMLLGIGALPQNVAEPESERGDAEEGKPPIDPVITPVILPGTVIANDKIQPESQDDKPVEAAADTDERIAEEDEENDESLTGDEDEVEDPDMTDEELDERDALEDEEYEIDEDEPEEDEELEEDEAEEDEPEYKEGEIPTEELAEDKKEASDKLEEPVAPLPEVKAEV